MPWPHLILLFTVIVGPICESAPKCGPETVSEGPELKECEGPNKQKIIGCQQIGNWSEICQEPHVMTKIDAELAEEIVSKMNSYRNAVAKGNFNNLPPSSRMLKLRWDPILMDLARAAAFRCTIASITPQCSLKASVPGYNAAITQFPEGVSRDTRKVLFSHLQAWFDQGEFADAASLESRKSKRGQDISQFLQMMTGLNSRVGCAVAVFKRADVLRQATLCVFGCNRNSFKVTYPIGKEPGEACKCGMDKTFNNLCSSQEVEEECEFVKKSRAQSEKAVNVLSYLGIQGYITYML